MHAPAPEPVVPAHTPPAWPAAGATAVRATGPAGLERVLLPAGEYEGRPHWTHDGDYFSGGMPYGDAASLLYWDPSGQGRWVLQCWEGAEETGLWTAADAAGGPTAITEWSPGPGHAGEPVIDLAGQAAPVLPRHNPPGHVEAPQPVLPAAR